MGHVYQRRFWSSVITTDEECFCVLRYIEANPLRAKLVTRAEDWVWGSLWERTTHGRAILACPPVSLPPNWSDLVNQGPGPLVV